MTRLLITAVAVLAVVALLPLLPLFPPIRPQPTPLPAANPLERQTVQSLRSLARRRGLRTVAGVPVAAARKSALLAALA